MADRVDEFTNEFESAIAAHRLYLACLPLVAATARHAARLGQSLEELTSMAGPMESMRTADLAALQRELASLKPEPPLEGFLTKAHALLQVIADGIVDGDSDRLRALLSEAESLEAPRVKKRGSGQIRLPAPAKVRCLECEEYIVGMRQPALNWSAITKVVREHEREFHGVYAESLRDELNEGLAQLRAGTAKITAGRYEIGSP